MEYEQFNGVQENALNQACIIVHDWAKKKGWWDDPRNDGELIALMHSELSEALEYLRASAAISIDGERLDVPDDKVPQHSGVAAEMADCVIRIMDFCGHHGIDLGKVIRDKHAYNCGRPHKHGKKF